MRKCRQWRRLIQEADMKLGNCLRYTGKVVFETDEKYAQAALDAIPDFENIYNETTEHKMMMFYLEDAAAVIFPMMGEGEKIDC